jgi:hypothetical protein
MTKIGVGLKLDKDIWDRSGKALREIGLSRSAFVETILQGVIADESEKSITEQIKGTAHKLIDKVKLNK